MVHLLSLVWRRLLRIPTWMRFILAFGWLPVGLVFWLAHRREVRGEETLWTQLGFLALFVAALAVQVILFGLAAGDASTM